jgi:ABC-2 type transport system ATP-binding protein
LIGNSAPMGDAVHASHLTCRYGRTTAVSDLSFSIAERSRFALLGPNGAGKTTTIRMLLNILRPTAGDATVLGADTRRLGVREFRSIGYVSESQQLPEWMTVSQLLAFCQPLYPTWDERLSRSLVASFGLPTDVTIGRLSRGMRVKAALVSSLAYRPRLLILDEPFGGLDPVMRDDLVNSVLERAGEERWSVLMSSHDLDEVARLVDTVGFLDSGRLALVEPLAGLRARFRRIEVTLADQLREPATAPPHWIGIHASGRILRFVDTRYAGAASERQVLTVYPGASVEAHPMTLREVFVAVVRESRQAQP